MSSAKAWSWIVSCAVGTHCFASTETASEPVVPGRFERYEIILDRKPFGAETLPVDAAKAVVPPDQSFTAKFKMAAVTRDRATGTLRVGLLDLKSNRSYMLGIGDRLEGVEVVDADYVTERARLRRDPEDYWVSMKGGSNHYEMVGRETTAVAPKSTPAPAPVLAPPGKDRPAGRSSYASRRQGREEARIRKELERLQGEEALRLKASKTNEPAVSVASVRSGKSKTPASLTDSGLALLDKLGRAEDSEMTPEEVSALLQEYQKELIRSGQTPLPIPLTPETDRALVEEGVLPAQE
jgi:hypothetical protein